MKQLIGLVMMLKDKVRWYCGKIDENKFVIMISLFLTKYNFHFAFVPSNWKEWYCDVDGKKFIDNDIRYCLSLGMLQFIWHDFTGIDFIHIIVDEDYNYHSPEQQSNIEKLMIILKKISDNHKMTAAIPCTFNYSIKPNHSHIYYLTIKHEWLVLNNLGVFATIRFPDCYLPKSRINYYFPEYNKNKILEGYIPYIKIEYFENETT